MWLLGVCVTMIVELNSSTVFDGLRGNLMKTVDIKFDVCDLLFVWLDSLPGIRVMFP